MDTNLIYYITIFLFKVHKPHNEKFRSLLKPIRTKSSKAKLVISLKYSLLKTSESNIIQPKQ